MKDDNYPWSYTDNGDDVWLSHPDPPAPSRWSWVIPVGMVIVALIVWGVWRYAHG